MANILFVTPYYPPEVGAPQARLSEMAMRLVKYGHQVTVLTTLPNHPSGVVQQEYLRGARRREVMDGVRVIRLWSYISSNKGFLHRTLAQLSFGCLCGFVSRKKISRPDIIFVESPRFLMRLGAVCWHGGIAAPISSLSVTSGRPLSRTQARAELGWDVNTFILMHAGSVSLAHGLTILLDAAERLRSFPEVQVVILGDGTAKSSLVAEAQRRQLPNVSFLGSQPHDRLPVYIAAADVCLASVLKNPLFEGTVPVKAYEAMACARPLVVAAAGESRHLFAQEAGAALPVEPGDSQALAQAILHLRDHPELAQRLGQQGRAFVKAHFDRDDLTRSLESHITAILGQNDAKQREASPRAYVPAGNTPQVMKD